MEYPSISPQDLNQIAQMKQIEELKRRLLSRILDKEAYERLGRVRSVNPQLASQVELYVLQLQQSGAIRGMIDDDKMKEILRSVSERKDITIKRK